MIQNILTAIEKWAATTDCGIVTVKIAAIGSTVWLLWCIFSYLYRVSAPPQKKKTQDERESETW